MCKYTHTQSVSPLPRPTGSHNARLRTFSPVYVLCPSVRFLLFFYDSERPSSTHRPRHERLQLVRDGATHSETLGREGHPDLHVSFPCRPDRSRHFPLGLVLHSLPLCREESREALSTSWRQTRPSASGANSSIERHARGTRLGHLSLPQRSSGPRADSLVHSVH